MATGGVTPLQPLHLKGNEMSMYDLAEEIGPFCDHIAIVSISETECQCMDCLKVWKKEPDFKSDFPDQDRG